MIEKHDREAWRRVSGKPNAAAPVRFAFLNIGAPLDPSTS
jgi:hypothetical protein